MLGFLSPYDRKLIAIALLGAFLAANVYRRGPIVDTPAENYLANRHCCTEYSYGWPLPIYQIYPEGFISAGEWLPWDCAPRPAAWNVIGIVADDICLVFLALLPAAWRRPGSSARVITLGRQKGLTCSPRARPRRAISRAHHR